MTPRRVTTLRLDDALLDGMQTVWERDGILLSEQVRRAVQAWLKTKGIDIALEAPRQGRRPEYSVEARQAAWDQMIDEIKALAKTPKRRAEVEIPEEVFPPLAGVRIRDLTDADYAQLLREGRAIGRVGASAAFLSQAWVNRTRARKA